MNCDKFDVVVYLMTDVSLLFESLPGDSTINDLRTKIFKIFALNTKNIRIQSSSGLPIDNTSQLRCLQINGKITVHLMMGKM